MTTFRGFLLFVFSKKLEKKKNQNNLLLTSVFTVLKPQVGTVIRDPFDRPRSPQGRGGQRVALSCQQQGLRVAFFATPCARLAGGLHGLLHVGQHAGVLWTHAGHTTPQPLLPREQRVQSPVLGLLSQRQGFSAWLWQAVWGCPSLRSWRSSWERSVDGHGGGQGPSAAWLLTREVTPVCPGLCQGHAGQPRPSLLLQSWVSDLSCPARGRPSSPHAQCGQRRILSTSLNPVVHS